MAKGELKSGRIDPHWPAGQSAHDHPISELVADRQGSLSPFGEVTFPLPASELSYSHPVTVINR